MLLVGCRLVLPTEFDALEICTPELQAKLQPLSRKLKALEKERGERVKVRRRTKASASSSAPKDGGDVEMADAAAAAGASASGSAEGAGASAEAGGELEPEEEYRKRELQELEALVDPDVKKDVGASVSGLFELVGASLSFSCAR